MYHPITAFSSYLISQLHKRFWVHSICQFAHTKLNPHAYMTEVGLGRIQALGPKWVAGYGPCRKWALLRGEKMSRAGQDTTASCPGQQRCGSGTAEQLATCRANLLGELSAVSLAEPEGSKCSRWPGNLRRSISPCSCSWLHPGRCVLVAFRRLPGDLARWFWCFGDLDDSGSWPEVVEGCVMPPPGTARRSDDGALSEYSILEGSERQLQICLQIKDEKRCTRGFYKSLTKRQ